MLLVSRLAASPSPAPGASPLKQIIDVRSRPLCTTLTQRIEPAVAGLLKNDALIEHGRGGLIRTGADALAGSAAAAMDRQAIRNVVFAMTHNFEVIDRILDDPARFPSVATTDDERAATAIKAQLLAIEARQRIVANALLGTLEMTAMGDMKTDFPVGNPTAHALSTNPTAIAGPAPGPGSMSAASSLSDPHEISLPALMDSDIAGKTIYDKLATLIAQHQVRGQAVESAAAASIVNAAVVCNGHSPPP
jgi:hypothetical protein